MARPGGLEPPAFWSVAKRSIQLGYGRPKKVAEREGFGPSMELLVPYPLSRRAPSASRTPLRTSGGRGRIRTHGRVNVNGFQDRRLRPLGHSSTIHLDVQRTKRGNDCQNLQKVNKNFSFFGVASFLPDWCEVEVRFLSLVEGLPPVAAISCGAVVKDISVAGLVASRDPAIVGARAARPHFVTAFIHLYPHSFPAAHSFRRHGCLVPLILQGVQNLLCSFYPPKCSTILFYF